MSRTLNDDFEDDDLAGGSFDLEKGSNQVGSGVASSYGGEGIDFDDELMGDGPGGGALELDLPGGGRSAPPKAPPPPAPAGPAGLAGGGPVVPDLALDAVPSKAPPAAASAPGARASGAHPAAPAMPVAPPPALAPPPSSSGRALSGSPPSGSGGYAAANAPPPSASGQHAAFAEPAAPSKPSAAAVIAKYPPPPAKVLEAPMYAIRVVLRQLELRTDLESLRRRRSPDVPLYEAALKAYEPRTFRLGMAINCAAFAVATFIFFLPVIIRFMRD